MCSCSRVTSYEPFSKSFSLFYMALLSHHTRLSASCCWLPPLHGECQWQDEGRCYPVHPLSCQKKVHTYSILPIEYEEEASLKNLQNLANTEQESERLTGINQKSASPCLWGPRYRDLYGWYKQGDNLLARIVCKPYCLSKPLQLSK